MGYRPGLPWESQKLSVARRQLSFVSTNCAMSVTRDHLQHAYTILAERESTRLAYSQPRQIVRYPTPQHVFYSVANSAKYKASNRYSNIYAYDRTAVKVDGEGYLNANVVCDGRGMWWVASQVSY